ncbi:M15 family metallopeptidase, partial [Bacteroidales bacterium OttesenSCG-928-I21]|nr:M15 family metallopeptidase [Bacteroidales bacterium OttesenSCG-928-I21]
TNVVLDLGTQSSCQKILREKGEIQQLLENMGLVNIKDSIPEILVDLKYSSDDNFLGFRFYDELTEAYVQYECLKKLQKAYTNLKELYPLYTFIIYDAVRSIESQQLMWDSLKVPEKQKFWYVANPAKGSIHNYGMALDLTIADADGKALDMGTDFDYFGELAYPNKSSYFFELGNLTDEQYENRNLLLSIMEEAGFSVSKTEWWHYNASSLSYAKAKYKIFSTSNINL